MALLFFEFTSLPISWSISWMRSGPRLAFGSSARTSCGLPMKARVIAASYLRTPTTSCGYLAEEASTARSLMMERT